MTKRMSLVNISRGPLYAPARLLIYGQPGVGKSTLACSAPGTIVVPAEKGTEQINTTRFPQPETFGDVRDAVQTLIDEPHDFKNLVIDTLDGLEGILFADICKESKADSIEEVGDGYGKGYTRAVEHWRELLAQLERLRVAKGMTIMFVAHSVSKTFKNPEGPDYDRYIPKMNERAWGVFFEWCDAVLFAQYEVGTIGGDTKKNKKAKATATGTRWLRTTKRSAWEAKNRYGFPDDIQLELERGFAPIAEYIEAPRRIRGEIESLLSGIKDVELARKVRLWLATVGENAIELQQGLERLRAA